MSFLTRAQAIALPGQSHPLMPDVRYPAINPEDPYIQQYDFYKKLLQGAWKIPEVDNPNYAPPIVFFDHFCQHGVDYTAALGNWLEDIDTTHWLSLDENYGWAGATTHTTAESENWLKSLNQGWLPATSGKPIHFETKVRITEGATNTSAWFLGLCSAPAKDAIVDTTGVMLATALDFIGFHKDTGELTYDFVVSNSTTRTTTASVGTEVSATAMRLGMKIIPGLDVDGAENVLKAQCIPYVNGVAGTALEVLLSGLEEMNICFGIKNITGTSVEKMAMDYVACAQGL